MIKTHQIINFIRDIRPHSARRRVGSCVGQERRGSLRGALRQRDGTVNGSGPDCAARGGAVDASAQVVGAGRENALRADARSVRQVIVRRDG